MRNVEESPLWSFVPLESYSVPPSPAAEKVRKGIRYLLERIRKKGEEDSGSTTTRQVPEETLNGAAPTPDWGGAVDAVGEALSERFDLARKGNVQVVVGAPAGFSDHIVSTWAQAERWPIVAPSGFEQILRGDMGILDAVFDDSVKPVVLPGLDRWYARHEDGLDCLEQLLHRLASRPGPCVLSCGIWSWLYLSRVLGIDGLTDSPLVLDAFDEGRLRTWFLELAGGSESPYSFREVGSERLILSTSKAGSTNAKEETDFLKYLAGRSRGLPGIAWATWRHALRVPYEADQESRSAISGEADKALVVPDWSDLDLPRIAGGVEQPDILVMHLLLLHGLIAFDLFTELLPMSAITAERSLHRLEEAGVLETLDGQWRISWLGYSEARDQVHSAGLLSGAF